MAKKKPVPGCWRCSMCNLNYRDDAEFRVCVVCDEELSHFSDIFPHADIIDRIKLAVAKSPTRKVDYGGITALEKFDRDVASLIGVDDFLTECGEKAAPND